MNTPGWPADEPGPRIGAQDGGEALLADSQDGPPWWAPGPEVVPPGEGTFRFVFRVTGHDDDGSPTIAATVSAVLRFPPPVRPDARPVDRTGLAVRLRIPFVAAETGAPTATELPVEATERDGVVHCRAEIHGAVARAAYGALSTPGFQPDDGAGLVVDASFVGVQEAEATYLAVPETPTAILVPVRDQPFEELFEQPVVLQEPPREEHPVPEEHPNWAGTVETRVVLPQAAEVAALRQAAVADAVLSELTLPETAISESVLPETALPEIAMSESATPEAGLSELAMSENVLSDGALPEIAMPAIGLLEAGLPVMADGAVLRRAGLFRASRNMLALPRAAGATLVSDDVPVGDLDLGELVPRTTGLDPDGFSPQPTTTFTFDIGVAVTRRYRLPLLVPCRDHPDLYRQDLGEGVAPVVVGCQEAFQLGRVPARRFAPAPRLDREHRYAVWESLQQPATYLVVPAHYRVARGVDGRPELEWLQVFDATVDTALPCLLQARCVPDLAAAELAELETRLRVDAGGRDVRVLLPSSPSVGATGVAVRSSTLDGGLRAVLDDDGVRVALRVDHTDAVVVVGQLRGGEAVAQVAFDTGDPRLALPATLHLDVDELAGPYPDGPIAVTAAGLRNDADTAATVTALWTRSVDGWVRGALPAPARVPAHGTAAVAVVGDMVGAPPADRVVPEVRLDAAAADQLLVRNVYLENLHTAVLVRRDVDLAAARVASVTLGFAVSGVEVARAVLPAAAPTLEVTLVQPLVAGHATLDRKITVTATLTGEDGSTRAAAGSPAVVDLSAGAVVKLSRLLAG